MFRILYWFYRFFSWLRHRTLRRVSRAGLAVGAGFLIISTVGLDTENTVAYQAIPLLLFLLMASFPFFFFFRGRFSAERLLPRYGTAGVPFSYRVLVRNLTSKTQSSLVLFEDLVGARPGYRDWAAFQRAAGRWQDSFRLTQTRRLAPFKMPRMNESPLPPVPPRQEAEARVEFTPLRRGLLRFSGVVLARPDPLGLTRAFANVPLPQTVLILPKRYPLPPIALPGRTKYQHGGVTFAADVGQSEEFVSLRDYRRGDPLRHIHWRSWAKVGKPIVKEFEDEFFVRHALVLDTFIADSQSEIFEEAVSVAASFACAVLNQESLLDLLFVGPHAFCFTAGRGLAYTDQMLEILASVRASGEASFNILETLVLQQAAILSGCICVFLDWNKQRQELVKKLKALGVPVLVVVIAPANTSEAMDPGPLADEPHRFHVLKLGKIQESLARLS
ncbi:MAG TPA: DUF58 domain-containing protein [Verrucomicrobiae bacterium]|nr:DUF58 domain-containing protein [Verrucomicrobiae bacterium]